MSVDVRMAVAAAALSLTGTALIALAVWLGRTREDQ